ncbi:hypothetical protein [Mycolicibacterium hodleri]|uniref:Secreted protein n=1 Tax=Mycolicibacterium hodleri TaxID=49897 RepID=A0A502ELI7_9MYCO|nr:hypothetical protein [Mycolicibacterium hodleri]TPG37161.1 hypothetical protein EAH80_04810 [Mycolicibacterium hodleri]
MSTISTIKKIAASAAIAASLGLGGLGLATGIAAAAPADISGTSTDAGPSTSSSSEEHAKLQAVNDNMQRDMAMIANVLDRTNQLNSTISRIGN